MTTASRPLCQSRPSKFGRRLWVRVAVCGAVAVAAFAPLTAPAQDLDEAVVAVIKAPPARQLTDRLMAVARKVQPGPQTEALPFILGGMLGDPMLEGISATENLGLVLLAAGDEIHPVLMMKLPEESPIRANIGMFGLLTHEAEEWFFAFRPDFPIAALEGREASLVSAVRSPRRYDIEMSANADLMRRKLREGMEEADLAALEPQLQQMARATASLVTGELDSVEDLRAGLNVSGQSIDFAYRMAAREGTPLAAFLDQTRTNDFAFARYLPADGAIAYLGAFDVAASRRYMDHVFGRIGVGDSGFAGQIRSAMDLFFQSTDGATGGVMSMQNMEVELRQISPSTLSNEELVKMLEQTVAGLTGWSGASSASEPQLKQRHELMVNHLQVGEVQVHVLRSETALDPESAAQLEEQLPGFTLPTQRQDFYYAVANGFLLAASDGASIASTIEAVASGEPVENSLASLIELSAENLFEFRVDLLRYVGGVAAPFMTPEMAQVMADLERRQLQPVRGSFVARGGQGEMVMRVPVDTMVAVFQAVSSYMASQQEQER